MGDTGHFDSRYDPIYQRGGTGNAGAPPVNGANVAPAPGPREHPAAPVGQSPRSEPEDEANVVEVSPVGALPSDAPGPPSGLNPFVVALWILGAALLVLGLWAVFAPLQVDETAVNGPFPQWVFLVSQSAGGIVISGSIVTAVAGALSALAWEQRRRR